MTNRNIEIDDALQDRVDSAIEDTKQLLLTFLADNPDTEDTPCLSNDLDYSGSFHEIVDGSVPIYTGEINDTWYPHGSAVEEAYENAGIGENPRENNGMAAIYCYVEQEVAEWYHDNAEGIFEGWQEEHNADENEGDE